MKILLSILCFFSIQFSFSQNRLDFQVKEVTDVPQCKMVSAENYCRAFQWNDSAGNNFLVLKTIMEQGSDPNEGDFTEITLTALHYIHDEAHIVWKTNDFIKHCMFDATLEVIDSSICITDLNKDGQAEISFVYKMGCRSSVDPLTLKLLLYDGRTRYSIAGTTKEIFPNGETGGEKMIDPSFANAPKTFIDFANQQWEKFSVEKFDVK